MKLILPLLLICFSFGCKKPETSTENISESKPTTQLIENPTDFYEKLSNAAISIIDPEVVYTPAYVGIKYPNGNVPPKTGVCSDVVIRAYRKLGIDLQKEVHEDMKTNFSKYPKTWGLKTTDKNIDHRRVPNLEVFFARKGKTLTITKNASDYKTGDIVTWLLAGDAIPHIGIVTHIKSNNGNPMIVHNVGSGQVLEDCLLSWKIVGHFRYEK
ncbi:MAG TPA: DUF1287 domain-containing protein [Flavobacterium sp.]|uniref:DUF1287 domain-containing protein n=1 Tax=Flavobacterium sp. TaxID=239 RepID=UPI002B4B42CF|nr:DUF1287 domain-containing protein [Flavobacterium sp.]HLO73837.1 DUF1287 domain-containing protein [Flavobacterium sp.]